MGRLQRPGVLADLPRRAVREGGALAEAPRQGGRQQERQHAGKGEREAATGHQELSERVRIHAVREESEFYRSLRDAPWRTGTTLKWIRKLVGRFSLKFYGDRVEEYKEESLFSHRAQPRSFFM